jgi:ribonuclease HI
MWKLRIPSKVKIFLWNALHGSVPLKSILVNRHIGDSGQCPICTVAAEDVHHLLFSCPVAEEIWKELRLDSIINEVVGEDRSGSVVLEILLRQPASSMPNMPQIRVQELIGVTCWYLWWLRRKRTHGEPVPQVKTCATSILGLTANFMKSYTCDAGPSMMKWSRPLSKFVKVNVDAAFQVDIQAGATAAVIRDTQGRFIAASCYYLQHIDSAAAAEAYDMRNGLALAASLGFNAVQAESDALDVVNACNGEDFWWSSSAAIFVECMTSVAAIGKVEFKHCPREINVVAHTLARYCFESTNSCNWVDEPPSCIMSKLLDDVIVV